MKSNKKWETFKEIDYIWQNLNKLSPPLTYGTEKEFPLEASPRLKPAKTCEDALQSILAFQEKVEHGRYQEERNIKQAISELKSIIGRKIQLYENTDTRRNNDIIIK